MNQIITNMLSIHKNEYGIHDEVDIGKIISAKIISDDYKIHGWEMSMLLD